MFGSDTGSIFENTGKLHVYCGKQTHILVAISMLVLILRFLYMQTGGLHVVDVIVDWLASTQSNACLTPVISNFCNCHGLSKMIT